jgi:hypothetical protein
VLPSTAPGLDLAVVAPAGYALSGHHAVTGVGLVEPARVEDAYLRRGLTRALLTHGLERDAARALYVGAGFRVDAAVTAYRRESARSARR